MKPRRRWFPSPRDEVVEAEALELLSGGFEWRYEAPLLVFTTAGGVRITLDGGVRRWRKEKA